jgi:hypothetical protein
MTNYPEDYLTPEVMGRVELCKDMSKLDMFTTTDLDLRNMIDNYMVRQIAGRLTDYPFHESEWPAALETAKQNLRRLNHIGFQETYDADFEQILRDLNMPRLDAIPKDNATEDVIKRARMKGKTYNEDPSDVAAAMAPLVRWDEQLYEYARQLRSNKARGDSNRLTAYIEMAAG